MNIDDAGGLLITTKTLTEKEKQKLQTEWKEQYFNRRFEELAQIGPPLKCRFIEINTS